MDVTNCIHLRWLSCYLCWRLCFPSQVNWHAPENSVTHRLQSTKDLRTFGEVAHQLQFFWECRGTCARVCVCVCSITAKPQDYLMPRLGWPRVATTRGQSRPCDHDMFLLQDIMWFRASQLSQRWQERSRGEIELEYFHRHLPELGWVALCVPGPQESGRVHCL